MDNYIDSLYAREVIDKSGRGARLTGNEQRRLASLLRINYRPMGSAPAQVIDRIHSIGDPYLGALGITSNELHFSNSTVKIDIDGNGIVVTRVSNGKKVTIAPGSIAQDMSIRTISICSGGVTKSMDLLASAPY